MIKVWVHFKAYERLDLVFDHIEWLRALCLLLKHIDKFDNLAIHRFRALSRNNFLKAAYHLQKHKLINTINITYSLKIILRSLNLYNPTTLRKPIINGHLLASLLNKCLKLAPHLHRWLTVAIPGVPPSGVALRVDHVHCREIGQFQLPRVSYHQVYWVDVVV